MSLVLDEAHAHEERVRLGRGALGRRVGLHRAVHAAQVRDEKDVLEDARVCPEAASDRSSS